ncbi:MAG: TRAP transporter large permease subunit, partial [Peptococcaceae bacterium]|nr:TRAP transporter large permease subunit [Peptococcaceae bacterium]
MAVLLFAVFAVTLLLGIPVAFSIMLSAVAVLVVGDVSLGMVAQRMFASVNSFPLVAVPFFILAGDLLANGAISRYLVAFAESFLGMIKGGLSIISVVVAMFFAAISGSGAATTAAVGATLIPQLKERGYKEDQSAALIAAAGTIGVVIPPSVPMVLYAVAAGNGVTVNRLFANGFVPGLMMGGILIAISLYQAYKHSYPKGGSFELKRFIVSFF